jgi:Transposase and inactivated derivatives
VDQDTLKALLKEAMAEVVEEKLQALLELDRWAFLQEHGGRANGHYPRKLETAFGAVELKVPRDRKGQYTPSFLPRYARRTPDLTDLVLALYASGVSDRKVAQIVGLLFGYRYSHETVSNLTELVQEEVEAFRHRPLPRRLFAVYLDALFLKLQYPGKGIEKQALYAALGLAEDGRRILLGFWLFPNEGAVVWEELLKELRSRGLVEVLLFITDGLAGIGEAIHRVYPRAEWQYSILHKLRATQAQVKRRDASAILADLKRVYRAPNRAKALEGLKRFTQRWQDRYPRVTASWWNDSGALLRFYDYPEPLWRYLRSTNLIEQFFRELRRSTKVRDHKFPKPESVYKLVYLEAERREGRWDRKLPGFADVQEEINDLFNARYPATQTSTQKT